MTGASGFIGRNLAEYLRERGHTVVPLSRSGSDPTNPFWDLGTAGEADAVVHLAGENIAQRWTKRVKERIYQSRVRGTRWLSEALAKLPKRPATLICASGSAYYGSRGDAILDEQSAAGTGFLARLTQDWEAAAEPARAAGIRVVHMRIGLVLHPKGGALAKMLPAFHAGLGGKLGDGKHYWSWIALPDMLAAIEFILNNSRLTGPVNMVGPTPVTNEQFTKALGAVLQRPTFFTAPKFGLRLMMGEMADEALFASFRILPRRLQESGFVFEHPELKPTLEYLLNDASP
jgi:uncharacterized protein (TIGR01777 family)